MGWGGLYHLHHDRRLRLHAPLGQLREATHGLGEPGTGDLGDEFEPEIREDEPQKGGESTKEEGGLNNSRTTTSGSGSEVAN